jgi:hypothetical protein
MLPFVSRSKGERRQLWQMQIRHSGQNVFEFCQTPYSTLQVPHVVLLSSWTGNVVVLGLVYDLIKVLR